MHGTANIILRDGCKAHLKDGIHVPSGSTLNIYAGNSGSGKLYVDRSKADTAAIGGDGDQDGGTINIHWGIIDVRGGSHNTDGGAGIGGGNKGGAGNINIYGGTVTAKGGPNAAGIGTGAACFHSKVNTVVVSINGGKITATPGEIIQTENNIGADPGAAIGAGGYGKDASVGNGTYESYFVGD